MKIEFVLDWLGRCFHPRDFKSEGSRLLFLDYTTRIAKFVPCSVVPGTVLTAKPTAGTRLWVCERLGGRAKEFTSEELARQLEKLDIAGTKILRIVVGGPDGFSAQEVECLAPDLIWSLGKLTLPHELAAVVAGEQIYRAWTILRGLPYHCGH